MATLLDEFTARGLVHDATPHLAERLGSGPVTAYVGFDPTADSLHVGNLVPIVSLAWLQRYGGTPIVLLGGGTGQVGDPSGKRQERPLLPREQVAANAEAIRAQLAHFLDFDGPRPARMLNNAAWLEPLSLLEFLRDVGKHFTLSYMLQKEAVKSRMDEGLSFTEFSYMLVQAYDFLHLFRAEGCDLQIGGSDQWGNITAGIELVARAESGQAHGLVLPLLTTSTGAKFGKSEGENVWLDPARTSPYRFYQFWLNADDRDVERFLKFFSFRPLADIAAVMAEQARDPASRTAQRELAREVTTAVHGADTTSRVIAASEILFGDTDLARADQEVFRVLAGELSVATVPKAQLSTGWPLVDALVETGLAGSKGDARRGLAGRGYSLNGEQQGDAARMVGSGDLLAGRYVLLRKGKKHYALVEAV